MKTRITKTILNSIVCFLFTQGCAGGDSDAAGERGKPCYPNGTCNQGLECRNDVCVKVGDSASDPEAILSRCLACGERECATEAEECDAAGGCGDVVSCWVKCLGDASCVEDCDVSALTADDLQLVNQYFQCIATTCVSDCSAPVDDPNDLDLLDTSNLESCSEEGESQGSCVSDDLLVCEDGLLRPVSCDGCGITVPSTTCVRVHAFAMEEVGDDFDVVTPNQMTFEQETDEVNGEWYLEAYQVGVIQFVFSEPLDPSRIEISSVGKLGYVTLELPGGDSGCQYTVESNGRLQRFWDGDWEGCWGDFASYSVDEPSTMTVMSIRTPMTYTNETVDMHLREILL